MSRSVHITVEEIRRETDKAFLVVYGGEEMWLPKTQVANDDEYYAGMKGQIGMSITEWIAKEKGIEGED